MTTTAPRTCTIDGRDLHMHETGRHACTPCTHRMAGWLTELPNQLVVLRASNTPERGSGPRVSRSRTAPIPPRLDVLNLLGPSAPAGTVNPDSPPEDQIGDEPLHETLYRWVARVRDARRLTGPTGLVPETLAAWLEPHLDWCAGRPWVAAMYADLDQMMRKVWGVTSDRPRRHAITRPCPRPECDSFALVHVDGERYIECTLCGALYTQAELEADAPGQLVELQRAGITAPTAA